MSPVINRRNSMRPRFFPMGIGDILDQTFKLLQKHFFKFIAVVAVVQVPLFLCVGLLVAIFMFSVGQDPSQFEDLDDFLPVIVGAIVMFLVFWLGSMWSTAALIRGVSDAYLDKETTVGQAYRKVLPRLLTIVIAALAVLLIPILCIAPGFGMIIAGTSSKSGEIILPGILLFIPGVVFAVFFWLRFAVVLPAIVIENISISQGFSRSWRLLKGNLGKTFGILFLTWLIAYMIQNAISAAPQFIGFAAAINPVALLLLSVLFQAAGQILVTPIQAIPPILLYYDMRIRKEGFDLQMLAESMGTTYQDPDNPNFPDDQMAPYHADPRPPLQ